MRKFYCISLGMTVCTILSCMSVPSRPSSPNDRAPSVAYIIPDEVETLSLKPVISLIFSRPIDMESIGPESILLVSGNLQQEFQGDLSDLYKAIEKEKLPTAELNFEWEDPGRVLTLSTEEDLLSNAVYTLLVTTRVLSAERIPLNQGAPSTPQPFEAVYQTASVSESRPSASPPSTRPPEPDQPPPSPSPPIADSIEAEPTSPQAESPESPKSDDIPNDTPNEDPAPTEMPERPPQVALNEIFYDAVGSDTDGALFVELFGTPGLSIGGYQIAFINGDDGSITEATTLPDGAQLGPDGFYVIADSRTGSATLSQVIEADLIDNFDPQNGPDAVQLIDPAGNLVDTIGYGEGIVAVAKNGLATTEGKPTIDVANGHSIERKNAGVDTNDNFNDFIDREIPTPGK